MGNPFFYLVMFCVANLAIIAAEPTSEEKRDSETNDISMANENEIASSDSKVQALESVTPFVEPPRKDPYSAVDNNTREISIQSGAPFRDFGPVQKMFQKYFLGCTLGNFTFIGNGFARFFNTTRTKDKFALEISPLKPGSYEFEYEGFKQAQTIRNVWTVHSLGSLTIRNNAFFELVPNLTRHEVTNATDIRDYKLVGIERRKEPKSLLVYGLADEFKNDTILVIRGHSKARPRVTLTKVRLLLEESPRHSKVDRIEVWMGDFEGTISDKRKMARCVAAQYGASHLDFEEVRFVQRNGTTVFTAQLPDRDTCKQLGRIKQGIFECAFKVKALNLTCASGESRSGPEGFFTTRTSLLAAGVQTSTDASDSSRRRGHEKAENSSPAVSFPSNGSGLTGSFPSTDSGPDGSSPSENSSPKGSSPSKNLDSRDFSPSDVSGPNGSSSSRGSGSRGDSPSTDSSPSGTSPSKDSGTIRNSPTEPSVSSSSKRSGSTGSSPSKDSSRAEDSTSEASDKQTSPRFSKADFSSSGGRDKPAKDGRDKPADDDDLSWFWELLNWVAVFSATFVIICVTICLWELLHRLFFPSCIV